jgi:hypothetical protein
MSLSSILHNGQISHGMIPPRITKGELITGNQMQEKIPVPAGEDGSVLQADSTTNTGLRWVPHEPIAKAVKHELGSVIQFLKPLIQERIIKEAERLESLPKLFVRFGTTSYTIPLDTSKPVQSVIDYLDEMYLFSIVNGRALITLQYAGQQLVPERTLADYNIQNESTVNIVRRQQGGRNEHVYHRGTKLNKSKKSHKKSCKITRNWIKTQIKNQTK